MFCLPSLPDPCLGLDSPTGWRSPARGGVWAASALLCLWRTPVSVLPWLPCPLLRLWHCCEHSVLPAVFLQGCVSSWSPLLAAEKPALLCWASTLRLPPPKHITCKPARGTCSKEAGAGFDFPLWLWGRIFVQAPAENKLDFGKVKCPHVLLDMIADNLCVFCVHGTMRSCGNLSLQCSGLQQSQQRGTKAEWKRTWKINSEKT